MLALMLLATPLGPLPGPQVSAFPYHEGFESGDGGFVPGGTLPTWEHGTPDGRFIDHAYHGTNAWVTNLDGDYAAGESSYIESPVFDCTAMASDPVLQFRMTYEHGPLADSSWVEVSLDGGPFEKLGAMGTPDSVNWYTFGDIWRGAVSPRGFWRLTRHGIPGGAGRLVSVRWRLEASTLNPRDGIGLDEVLVFEDLVDVGVALLELPESGGQLGSGPVTAVLVNNGAHELFDVPIRYTVSGPIPADVVEVFPGPIPPGRSRSFTFATEVDLSLAGDYALEVRAELVADQLPHNDARAGSVRHQTVVTTLPYHEDFELGDGDFITTGTRSSWAHGSPTGSFIGAAASGARAWVTDPGGVYNTAELSYLVTPPLDLGGAAHDVMLEFSHVFEHYFSHSSFVEMSLDGGPFARLGEFGDPVSVNWYNDFQFDRWTGSSEPAGSWRTARHILPDSAGRTVVLRWHLRGNGGERLVDHEGIGIDDVRVFEPGFGLGHPPTPGVALLDVSSATEAVGFGPQFAYPGPYFAPVSASSESLDIHVEGAPNQAVTLLIGSLGVGTFPLPFGQLDLGPDFLVFASGARPGIFDSFFVTTEAGHMDVGFNLPPALVGSSFAFQAALADPLLGLVLSNAVQVTVLP